MVCVLRIKEATTSPRKKKVYLYMILAVERIRIDTDLQLFGLNLQILVTAEIASELLRLVCWRFANCYLQLLCLTIRWLWARKKIESRNRFRHSKKFVSICPWWWIKSPSVGAFGPESSRLWVAVWLRTAGRAMSLEGSMASELWLRAAVRFRRGWDSRMEILRASCVPAIGHVSWSWQRSNFDQ